MARRPYKTARQEHVGDALDDLAERGLLSWRWDYDTAKRRAVYHVTTPGEGERGLDTAATERLVQHYYTVLGITWLPVPHPGGERERDEILRRLAGP